MKGSLIVNLFLMSIPEVLSSGQEVKGGIVNGQPVGKCVAGFCLPAKYSSLDPPTIVDANNNSKPNRVNITTDIMDVLMVRFLKHSLSRTFWEKLTTLYLDTRGQRRNGMFNVYLTQ